MNTTQNLPNLSCLKASSFEEFQKLRPTVRELYFLMQDVEKAILYNNQNNSHFKLNGYCYICDSFSYFGIDYRRSQNINGLKIPNWREGLSCVQCGLNNRMRGALHIFFKECSPTPESKIYLTEQITPLYKYVAKRFPFTYGSEYMGDKIPYGTMRDDGIRNESLTCLSFEQNKFDYILSFDVLEHIPDYIQAFKECLRVLKPKGKLVFSVPFNINSPLNIIRAKVDDRGNITHIKPPQYHGDPMSKDGILCFQDFGWQMLDQLKSVGFINVEAIIYRSRFYGYLGGSHIIFVAEKNVNNDKLNAADRSYNLGRNYALHKQFKEAIEAYSNAIKLNPNVARYYHSLGDAYCEQKQWDKAIDSYKQAINLNQNLADAHYKLGKLLQQNGKNLDAVELYLKAIQARPEFPKPYSLLRNTPTNLKFLEKATECYRKLIKVKPDYTPLQINLADALTKQNKIREATIVYKNAVYTQTKRRYPELVKKTWNLSDLNGPDFVIIGAGKSGTSSLYVYLMQHPQIVPPIDKEIHFFSHRVAYGKEWYLAHFVPTTLTSQKLITGEASTSYFHTCYLNTHRKMHELIPNAKLILVLRNPVDRAISHYHQTVRLGQERRSLETAISSELNLLEAVEDPIEVAEAYWKRESGYLWVGLYYHYLQRWMTLYPLEQFLVLNLADFNQMPEATMNKVYSFLGVSEHKLKHYPKYNSGAYKDTESKTRKLLSEFFASHNQKLEDFLGIKFNW